MAPDVKRTFAFLTMGWYGVWSFFRKHSFVDGSHCHALHSSGPADAHDAQHPPASDWKLSTP